MRLIAYIKSKRAKTQKAYIAALTPTHFGFIGRIPFMLSVIFVCMSLSTGFPLLLPICCVCFLVMFIVEKKIFISYSRKPPLYSDKITKVVIRNMLFSLVLHSFFAIFIYGESELFSFHFTLTSINGEVQVNETSEINTFWQMLYHRIKLCPFFVVFGLVVIGVILFDVFLNSLFGNSLRKKMFKDLDTNIKKSYFENFKTINYNDFPKYDFRLAEE